MITHYRKRDGEVQREYMFSRASKAKRRRRRRAPTFPCIQCGGRQAVGRGALCRFCATKAQGGPPILWFCEGCGRRTRDGPRCVACERQRQREFEAIVGLPPRDEAELLYESLRGQQRRDPAGQRALRFAAYLRRQGFLPSGHFVQRFLQRAQARGLRFDPRLFAQQFFRARHYRQTRPGYNTRIAVMHGIPIVYRMGGKNANRIVLVSLLPEGALPPVVSTAPPRPLNGEAMFGRLGQWARGIWQGRRSVPSTPNTPIPREMNRQQMAAYLQQQWVQNPILRRVANAQHMIGAAQRRELQRILKDFQRQTGIIVERVPEQTIQSTRGHGNLASFRSRPGYLQIERQVFQDPNTLMREVRHELAYHYAGGPNRVPILTNQTGPTAFNALNLLEMMIQSSGQLPAPVAPELSR